MAGENGGSRRRRSIEGSSVSDVKRRRVEGKATSTGVAEKSTKENQVASTGEGRKYTPKGSKNSSNPKSTTTKTTTTKTTAVKTTTKSTSTRALAKRKGDGAGTGPNVILAGGSLDRLSAKEKVQDEIEENLIKWALKQQLPRVSGHHPIEETSNENELPILSEINEDAELPKLHDTLTELMNKTRKPLLDWTSHGAQLIGTCCKIYWDGENAWFTARILNYDPISNKHFVYYIEDCQREWIDLSSEPVLLFQEFCLMKLKRMQFTAVGVRFSLSKRAHDVLKKIKGYDPEGHFVEACPGTKFGFAKKEELNPFLPEFYPPEPYHPKFLHSLESAQEEQAQAQAVVEVVKKTMIKLAQQTLQGEQWIGTRVRTATQRISTKYDRMRMVGNNPVTAAGRACGQCVGTICRYAPTVDEYLVRFDDPQLQPQWITLAKSNRVEILIADPRVPESINSDNTKQFTEAEKNMDLENDNPKISDEKEDTQVASSVEDYCQLCDNACLDNGVPIHWCQTCHRGTHEYCVPSSGLRPLNDSVVKTSRSANVAGDCPHCQRCSCCGEDALSVQLMWWYPRRLGCVATHGIPQDEHANNSSKGYLLLCGLCLRRYKAQQDYCAVCLRLYESATEGEFAIYPSVNEAETKASSGTSDTSKSDRGTDSGVKTEDTEGSTALVTTNNSILYSESDPPLSEEYMMQCGQCHGWIHAACEGMAARHYTAVTDGTHPVWGDEYICPPCRRPLSQALIKRLSDFDIHHLFAAPVTEEEALGYFDVIRNPMDFSLMTSKATEGFYKAVQAVREDVELMARNALVFNRPGDDFFISAARFYLKVFQFFAASSHPTRLSAHGIQCCELIGEQLDEDPREDKKVKANRKLSQLKSTSGNVSSSNLSEKGNKMEKNLEKNTLGGVDSSLNQSTNTGTEATASDTYTPAAGVPIEISLGELNEPASYVTTFVALQSAEEAVFAFAHDRCLVCGGAACADNSITVSKKKHQIEDNESGQIIEKKITRGISASSFLFCIDCGEGFHAHCVLLDPVVRSAVTLAPFWRCLNCKVCECCRKVTSEDAELLICEGCDLGYHRSCLANHLGPPPNADGRFYCENCLSCDHCGLGRRNKRSECGDIWRQFSSGGVVWGPLDNCCIACHGNGAGPDIPSTYVESDALTRSMNTSGKSAKGKGSSGGSVERTRLAGGKCYVCAERLNTADATHLCVSCGYRVHITCVVATSAYHRHPHGIRPLSCRRCVSTKLIDTKSSSQINTSGRSPEDFACHFGSGPRALSLASRIATLQRQRFESSISARCESRILSDNISQSNQVNYGLCPNLFVVLWAIIRCNSLQRTDPQATFIPTLNACERLANDPNIQSGLLLATRARRFIAYFKRRVHLSSITAAPQKRSFKKNTTQGRRFSVCLFSLRNLSSEGILRLSSSAAAFLTVVDYELKNQNNDQMLEIVITLIELGILSALDLKYPPLDLPNILNNVLNFLRTLQRKLGYVNDIIADHLPSGDRTIRSLSADDRGWKISLAGLIGLPGINGKKDSTDGYSEGSSAIDLYHFILCGIELLPTNNPVEKESICRLFEILLPEIASYRDKVIPSHPSDIMTLFMKVHLELNAAQTRVFINLKDNLEQKNNMPMFKKALQTTKLFPIRDRFNSVTSLGTVPLGSTDTLVSTLSFNTNFLGMSQLDQPLRQRNKLTLRDTLAQSSGVEDSVLMDTDGDENMRRKTIGPTSNTTNALTSLPYPPTLVRAHALYLKAEEIAKGLLGKFFSDGTTDTEAKVLLSSFREEVLSELALCDEAIQSGFSDALKAKQEGKPDSNSTPEETLGDSMARHQASIPVEQQDMEVVDDVTSLNSSEPSSNADIDPANGADNESDDSDNEDVVLDSTILCQPIHSPAPLVGWKSSHDRPEWQDPRVCLFCGTSNEPPLLGRLVPFADGPHAHANCLLWAAEVEEHDGVLWNVFAARDRCLRQVCFHCQKRGATISCSLDGHRSKRCVKAWHLRCAIASNVLLLQTDAPDERDTAMTASSVGIADEDSNAQSGAGSGQTSSGAISVGAKGRWIAWCAVHAVESTNKLRSSIQFWSPTDSARYFICEKRDDDADLDSTSLGPSSTESICTRLAQRRTDKSLSSGSLTLLNLGSPIIDGSNGFSEPTVLYPHHFRSARIYWSGSQCGQRTAYIFEVLRAEDLMQYDTLQMTFIERSLVDSIRWALKNGVLSIPSTIRSQFATSSSNASTKHSESSTLTAAMIEAAVSSSMATLLIGPIFRVVALDRPQSPLFSKFIGHLFHRIMTDVEAVNSSIWTPIFGPLDESSISVHQPSEKIIRRSRFTQQSVYGMTPQQFFGLGQLFTRRALELIPESIAAMIFADPLQRYIPVAVLPTMADIDAVQRVQASLKTSLRTHALNGSTRADPFKQVVGRTGGATAKVARILTKGISGDTPASTPAPSNTLTGTGGLDDEEDDEYCTEVPGTEPLNDEAAELEARRQRFVAMSSAYIRCATSKLEVRPSVIHGGGLFAKINFERDEVLVEYIGEQIRTVVADVREAQYEAEGVGSCYLFRLDKDEIIDATRTGAMARFINHCCEPNAYATIVAYEEQPEYEDGLKSGAVRVTKHIAICAARDIAEGEEITYDYKFPREDGKLRCYCGAPGCAGVMN